jgi:hypothetical protein
MSEEPKNKIVEFIVNHWVSWVIEIAILGVIAYFTIAETRKTAEQTRAMLAKYDAAVSQYAKEKSQALDEAAVGAVESAKEKAKSVKIEDVKGLIKSFKSDNENETE